MSCTSTLCSWERLSSGNRYYRFIEISVDKINKFSTKARKVDLLVELNISIFWRFLFLGDVEVH